MKKPLRTSGLFISVITSLAVCLSGNFVQAQDFQSGEYIEEIIITGSFIKRKNQSDHAYPVDTLRDQDLSNIGATSISDLVNSLTHNTSAQIYTDSFEQARSAGATNINLRGLGVTSTLVLINGRRQTLSPAVTEQGDQFVDLTTLLPVIAVERVEILKDGASSQYGSDAVAGVVNFITRADFDGVELELDYQHNRYGSDEIGIAAIAGTANERGQAMVAINHLKRTSVPNAERRSDYANNQDSWSGFSMPSKVLAFDGPPGPPIKLIDPVCLDGSAFAEFPGILRAAADGSCQLNYGFFGDIIAETEQTQFFTQGSLVFDVGYELFAEAGYASNKTTFHSTPSQPQLDEVRVPAHHPDAIAIAGPDPFAGSASDSGIWFGRPRGAGSAANNVDNYYRSWRIQLGARGDLTNGWYWESAYTYSDSDADNSRLDIITANLQAAMDGMGGGNGDQYYHWLWSAQAQNTTDMDGFIFGQFGYNAKASLTTLDAHISGPLLELPAGNLDAAIGVQYRKDTLEYDFNALSNLLAFNFFGGGDDFSGSQRVYALFAELAIPVTPQLELQVALRHEDFDTASTTDPKLGVLWRPSKAWSVRASYSSSFRIATLFQQESQFITPQTANDPLAGGEEVSFISLLTGDPKNPLDPQESDVFNVGATWAATNGLTLSLDYWRFDYQDFITPESAAALLASDPNSEQIERGAGGAATRITTFYRNAGSIETDGIDFSVSYDVNLGHYGTLKPTLNGTYILSYDLQDPLLGDIDGLGNVNDENIGASNVEFRSNLSLHWLNARHEGNLYVRHIGDYKNDNDNNASVASMTTVDAQYAYHMLAAWLDTEEGPTLTLGVRNLFDRAAPTVRNSVGYDATVHDPRGRTAYMNLKQVF